MNDIAQGEMTEAQEAKLRNLCERYGVEYDRSHYIVFPTTSLMMPGWAEGWIGGSAHANPQYYTFKPGEQRSAKHTIYVGVSPEGDSHS